jgi:hypothetical protein
MNLAALQENVSADWIRYLPIAANHGISPRVSDSKMASARPS